MTAFVQQTILKRKLPKLLFKFFLSEISDIFVRPSRMLAVQVSDARDAANMSAVKALIVGMTSSVSSEHEARDSGQWERPSLSWCFLPFL